jgi:hypothetical protein
VGSGAGREGGREGERGIICEQESGRIIHLTTEDIDEGLVGFVAE